MSKLLTLIDRELATLQQARALIAATGKKRPGRPAKATAVGSTAPTAKPKKKRKMSAEGRARIVAALKARWAAKKKNK